MNTNNKYNKIPVFYCKNCLSLSVYCEDIEGPSEEGIMDDEFKYCNFCGGVNIGAILFSNWQAKYVEKYGINFLEEL